MYLRFNGDISDAADEQIFEVGVRVWAANTIDISSDSIEASLLAGSIVAVLTITATANEIARHGDNSALARNLVRAAGESAVVIDGRELLAAALSSSCFEGFDACGRCGGDGSACADAENFMLRAGVKAFYNGTTELWLADVGDGLSGFLRPAFLIDGVMSDSRMFQTSDTAGTLLFDLGGVRQVNEVRVVWFCNGPQEWSLAAVPIGGTGFEELARVKHSDGATDGARLDAIPLQGTAVRTLQISLLQRQGPRYCAAEVMVFGDRELEDGTVSNAKMAWMMALWIGIVITVLLAGSELIKSVAHQTWLSRRANVERFEMRKLIDEVGCPHVCM